MTTYLDYYEVQMRAFDGWTLVETYVDQDKAIADAKKLKRMTPNAWYRVEQVTPFETNFGELAANRKRIHF